MYGSALKPKGNMVPSNLMQFSQADYFEVPPETFGLNTKGYYYVPSACKDGSVPCGVHFEFHGCEQSVDYLGEDFVIHAGYNDWAESNNIIVLYPQTHNIPVDNPKVCLLWVRERKGGFFNVNRSYLLLFFVKTPGGLLPLDQGCWCVFLGTPNCLLLFHGLRPSSSSHPPPLLSQPPPAQGLVRLHWRDISVSRRRAD